MHHKYLTIPGFIFSMLLLFAATGQAQDTHNDSLSGSFGIDTKDLNSELGSIFKSKGGTNLDGHTKNDNSEYGIGNVLGKRKKQGKVYKKTNKCVKIEVMPFGKAGKTYIFIFENGTIRIVTESDN
ncbi:hypothetical protein GC194_09760 [bacterium]|nr:hypothetical protein [bacterium]